LNTIKISKRKISAKPVVKVSYALSSLIFLASSFILVAISVTKPMAFDGFRASIMDMTAPVITTVNAPFRAATDMIKNASGIATLQQQNAELRAENAKLKEWYLTAQTLQSENKQLQAMNNFKPAQNSHFVTARILADTGGTFAKSIMVTAGTQDGVIKGSPVVSSQGVVGRVIEAGKTTSRVLLLSDMNSRIPVAINNNGKIMNAMLAGRNDSAPELIHVPDDSKIVVGAHIMTSGHGGVYPPGLPVGKVLSSKKGEFTAVPYMDMTETSYLKIVMPQSASPVWE
jgi:rod shape-determining protein MreC